MIRNIWRFWQKTRRAVPAKFQSLLTKSASDFWKSQGVYHEKYQPCPPGTVPLHRGGRNIHGQYSIHSAARAKHSRACVADGLPFVAAVWAGWKLEKMNRKNGKPPCVLRTHKAARAGRRIAILMSPRLHYITTEIRMEGKL